MADFKYIKEDKEGTVTIAPETTTPPPPTPTPPVTLNVKGTVNVTENLTVKGKINDGKVVGESLTVSGDSTLNNLTVNGKINDGKVVGDSLTVDGDSTLNKLTVNGEIKANKSVAITENLTVNGTFNLLPAGVIMMWFGDAKPPEGWAICDGTSDTPDLRGRFVMGADKTYQDKKDNLEAAKKAYDKDAESKNPQSKHWDKLTEEEKEKDTSELAKKIKTAENEWKKAYSGGSPSMIKQANIAGSGLDMSKAACVSEIDYPPYTALYYIMKI